MELPASLEQRVASLEAECRRLSKMFVHQQGAWRRMQLRAQHAQEARSRVRFRWALYVSQGDVVGGSNMFYHLLVMLRAHRIVSAAAEVHVTLAFEPNSEHLAWRLDTADADKALLLAHVHAYITKAHPDWLHVVRTTQPEDSKLFGALTPYGASAEFYQVSTAPERLQGVFDRALSEEAGFRRRVEEQEQGTQLGIAAAELAQLEAELL